MAFVRVLVWLGFPVLAGLQVWLWTGGVLVSSLAFLLPFTAICVAVVRRSIRHADDLHWEHDFSDFLVEQIDEAGKEIIGGVGLYDRGTLLLTTMVCSQGIGVATKPLGMWPSLFVPWSKLVLLRIYIVSDSRGGSQPCAELMFENSVRRILIPWKDSFSAYVPSSTAYVDDRQAKLKVRLGLGD